MKRRRVSSAARPRSPYTDQEQAFIAWLKRAMADRDPARRRVAKSRPVQVMLFRSIPNIRDTYHYETRGGKRVRVAGRRPEKQPSGRMKRPPQEGTVYPAHVPPRIKMGKKISLGVNESVMWKYFAESSYGKGRTLAPFAMREAFQNSRDAVYALPRGQTGSINIVFDENTNTASFQDTGVGMSPDTLVNKFLVLGQTGKSQDQQSVGGFGVAKAVILSLADPEQGGSWTLRTRNITLDSAEVGKVRSLQQTTPIQGTEIRWQNVAPDVLRDTSSLRNVFFSDWNPKKLSVRVNIPFGGEREVPPLHVTGRPIWQGQIGEKNRVVIRRISKKAFDKNPALRPSLPYGRRVVIRLNGLAQTFEWADALGEFCVDITTTARPGDADYPFDPHRTKVKYEISDAIDKALAPLASETISANAKRDTKDIQAVEKIRELGNEFWAPEKILPFVDALNDAWTKGAVAILKRVRPRGTSGNAFVEWAQIRAEEGTPHIDVTPHARSMMDDPDISYAGRYYQRQLATQLGMRCTQRGKSAMSISDAVRLNIIRWAATMISAAASGKTSGLRIAEVYGMSTGDALAEHFSYAGDLGFTIGYNLTYLRKFSDPREFASAVAALTIHELAHCKSGPHNEDFAAVMTEVTERTLTVMPEILDGIEKMWTAWRRKSPQPKAAPKKTTRKTKRKTAKKKTSDSGVPTLFSSVAAAVSRHRRLRKDFYDAHNHR